MPTWMPCYKEHWHGVSLKKWFKFLFGLLSKDAKEIVFWIYNMLCKNVCTNIFPCVLFSYLKYVANFLCSKASGTFKLEKIFKLSLSLCVPQHNVIVDYGINVRNTKIFDWYSKASKETQIISSVICKMLVLT